MRKASTLMLVAALLVAATAPTALATAPEETVYLSLGTSLAAGSQIDSEGNTTAGTGESYTDQLYQRVQGRIGADLQHVKLGCAGETTDQLLGGANVFGQPSACAGSYLSGSQIGDALATIAGGDVVLVTIDIGANDIIQAQNVCGGNAGCILAQIPVILGKVGQIVGTTRAAGYGGPIVAMNYYNPQAAAGIGYFPGLAGQHDPDPVLAQLSDALVQGFNGGLAQVYGLFGVMVADVYGAFNAGDFGDDKPMNGIPDNVDVLCKLSYMCPEEGVKANIHLNKHGYRVLAKTFLGVVATFDS
jgi:hypothetical protein